MPLNIKVVAENCLSYLKQMEEKNLYANSREELVDSFSYHLSLTDSEDCNFYAVIINFDENYDLWFPSPRNTLKNDFEALLW